MIDLTKITASVEKQTTVTAGVVTLLGNLSQEVATIKGELEAQGVDTAALANLQQMIDANTDALSAAVVANTPAATEPAPTDPPPPAPNPTEAV